MENSKFVKNQVYDNVYLIFIDASGHSNVVKNNPKDVSTQAFDLLYEKVSGRLQKVIRKKDVRLALYGHGSAMVD